MLISFEGQLQAGEDSFALVVSRYNETVTRRLLDGALAVLRRYGVGEEQITVVWTPGAFELPIVAHRLAHCGRYSAVCCLGAVIQGETTHHEYINQQVSRSLMDAGVASGVPVLFGVLTCQTMELAMDRAGGETGNKGAEAALAALEMVSLLRQLPRVSGPTTPGRP